MENVFEKLAEITMPNRENISQITNEQRELLDMLRKLSNGVANDVYFAENKENADVDKHIEQGIWFAKYMLERIEELKMASASKKENVQQ